MNTMSSLAHLLRLRCISSINKRARWRRIGVDRKIGLLETPLMPFFAGLIDANDSAKSDSGGKELCAHARQAGEWESERATSSDGDDLFVTEMAIFRPARADKMAMYPFSRQSETDFITPSSDIMSSEVKMRVTFCRTTL